MGNGTVIYDEWWWRERRKEGSWVGGEALTKRERKWNDLIYVCSTMPSLFLALYRCNAACALGGTDIGCPLKLGEWGGPPRKSKQD